MQLMSRRLPPRHLNLLRMGSGKTVIITLMATYSRVTLQAQTGSQTANLLQQVTTLILQTSERGIQVSLRDFDPGDVTDTHKVWAM